MENSFDAYYLFVLPLVMFFGALIYLFGFKKPVEPPLLEPTNGNEDKPKKKVKPVKEVSKASVSYFNRRKLIKANN